MTTFKIEDVRVDVLRGSGFYHKKILTHIPTGKFVEYTQWPTTKDKYWLDKLKKMVEDNGV